MQAAGRSPGAAPRTSATCGPPRGAPDRPGADLVTTEDEVSITGNITGFVTW